MRHILIIGVTLLLTLVFWTTVIEAGKGGGRESRGGGGRSKAKATRNDSGKHGASGMDLQQKRARGQLSGESRRPERFSGRDHLQERQSKKTQTRDSESKAEELTGRKHAAKVQRSNEERKLQHRLDTSQHLRDIAEKNGNDRLLDTADRMEQRAQEHYKKRLEKIDRLDQSPETGNDSLNETEDRLLNEFEDGASHPVSDALNSALQPDQRHGETASRLKQATGRNDALERRLLNEDRQLQQRLGTAQRLRSLAAENGNNQLLRAADRMEQTAVELYEARLENIGGFSDEISQPDPESFITVP